MYFLHNFIIIFWVFHFRWSEFISLQKHCDVELYRFFLQLLAHHAVCLEDLFELSNNFNAPLIHEVSRIFQNVLEISGSFFLFGRPREFSKPRFRNPRETRGDCIGQHAFFTPFPLQCTYFHYHFFMLSQFPVNPLNTELNPICQ